VDDLKNFLNQFEKLQQRKIKLQAEQSVLSREKKELLQGLPQSITLANLEEYTSSLEEELQKELVQLQVPQEHLDELTGIEDTI